MFEDPRKAALARAQLAQSRVTLRQDLRSGARTLEELLADPPPCIRHLLVYEVISMTPRVGRITLARLGRQAAVDKVNLFVPVVLASQRTREWVSVKLPVIRHHPLPKPQNAIVPGETSRLAGTLAPGGVVRPQNDESPAGPKADGASR